MSPLAGLLPLLDVPVLIVSAGVTDVIEEYLRQHGALSENVTICSNRLNYEADSTPKSVAPDPPITSFTKTTAYKSASSFFQRHADRRNLIVMGDSISDVDAGKNVPSDKSISIGFTNARPDMRGGPFLAHIPPLMCSHRLPHPYRPSAGLCAPSVCVQIAVYVATEHVLEPLITHGRGPTGCARGSGREPGRV